MIPKEQFVNSIETMRLQYYEDKKNGELLREAFSLNEFPIFENSKLYNSIIELLRIWFPKDDDGYCEIENYCFVLNFGRIGESVETAEEFFERMINNIKNDTTA